MLYQIGILRLNYRRDVPAARAAFAHMAEHAAGWAAQAAWTAAVGPLLDLATAHVALADRMGAPEAASAAGPVAEAVAPSLAPAAKPAKRKPQAAARRRREAVAAG